MSESLSDRVSAVVGGELGRRRMSRAALARLLGWSEMRLARRMAGEVAWDLEDLAVLAVHFDLSPAMLLHAAERGRVA